MTDKLERIEIDVANGICKINGRTIEDNISELHIQFVHGVWTIQRTSTYLGAIEFPAKEG